MNLIPWTRKRNLPLMREMASPGAMTPIMPIMELRREMDQLFDRFFREPWSGNREWWPQETWARFGELTPSVDLLENDKSITVRAELPGMEPGDVDIQLSGNVLTISGEKKESCEQKGEDYYHCERRFGSFRRSFELPTSADLDKIQAEFKNGVLNLTVAKTAEAKPRKVSIKGAKPALAGAKS
jgi:HSP20 family protein